MTRDEKDKRRFMSYVEVTEGCWDWKGSSLPTGYGVFHFRGKSRYAHRLSVQFFKGIQIPSGAVVMHSCDRPCCVNPDHLSVGTHTDNMRDASAKGRFTIFPDWRGIRNPKAKLSESQTKVVRSRYRSGERPRFIAADFGITTTRVWQIGRSA